MDFKSAYLYIAFCEGILDCVNFVNNVNFIKYTVDFLYKSLFYFVRTSAERKDLTMYLLGSLHRRLLFYSIKLVNPLN